VLVDGSTLPANVVVWAAPGDPWGQPTRQPLSAGLLTVHLALRGDTPEQPAQVVTFPDDRQHSLEEVFGDRLPSDPTLVIDRRTDTARAGHEAWTVSAIVPPNGNFGWSRATEGETYADRIIKVLERRGFALHDRLLWHVVRTPYDVERDNGAPGGAAFGPVSHGLKGVLGRAANRGDLFGLYYAGAGTHPGAGLPNVALSAASVANLIGPA
jgi:phytoene dehydrogenase-like protein